MRPLAAAALALALAAPARCADVAGVARSLLGTAWEGTFYVAPLGHQLTQRFPIRFVNHAELDDNGDLVYDFSKNIASANELERAGFAVADLHVDARCGRVPRRIRVQDARDTQDGPVLYGKVIATACSWDERTQQPVVKAKELTLKSLAVRGAAGGRRLTIDVEAGPGLLIHYDFTEAHPQGDLLAWLDQAAD